MKRISKSGLGGRASCSNQFNVQIILCFPTTRLTMRLKAALKSWLHFTSFALTVSDLYLTMVTKEIHSNLGQWLMLGKTDLAHPAWLCSVSNAFFSCWPFTWARLRLTDLSDLQEQNWISHLDYGLHLCYCIFGHSVSVFSYMNKVHYSVNSAAH